MLVFPVCHLSSAEADCDPGDYANTVLLCHFDGVDEATSTSDSSSSSHTITFTGNSKLDSEHAKFGTTSLKLTASGDYIDAGPSADWNFGTGDFSVEFWVWTSNSSMLNDAFVSNRNNGGADEWSVQTSQTGGEENRIELHSGAAVLFNADSGDSQIGGSTWVHMMVSRVSGTLRVFINGTSQGSVADSTNFSDTNILYIGNDVLGADDAATDGAVWIDELRIVKGAGVSSNFTPPTLPYCNS